MPSSRRERLYLQDIVEAAVALAGFVAGLDRDRFVGDDLVRSAVLHKLQVIGEAAARISEDSRVSSPDVPWRQVVGFRNFAVHAYFAVDWDIVWITATVDAPAVADAVRILLDALPPSSSAPCTRRPHPDRAATRSWWIPTARPSGSCAPGWPSGCSAAVRSWYCSWGQDGRV